MRLAVIVPAYGHVDLTRAVARAVAAEGDVAETWIIDNKGDYEPIGGETVIAPGCNLGWLGGCNEGLRAASERSYSAYVLLNNDVELSAGFFDALATAQHRSGAGLVGPTYDGFWAHQHSDAQRRSALLWEAAFIDGTCMMVDHSALEMVGLLDDDFAEFGWGGELDYCVRIREAGRRIVVTDAAYLRHHNEATAIEVHGEGYGYVARRTMYDLMNRKHGDTWDTDLGIDPVSHNTERLSAWQRRRQTTKVRR